MDNEIFGYPLEDWYPMEPAMGPPLPKWMEIFWPWYKPAVAELKLSNLIISPVEVQINYPVNISCLVENIGTGTGTKTIICQVEGEKMAEQQVTLAPGESKLITFEVVPTTAKTYDVSVDGLYGTFSASEAAADIRVENLVISPTECLVGETVLITVQVTNYGNSVGTKIVTCQVI